MNSVEYRAIRPDEIGTWRRFEEYCFGIAPADYDPYVAHLFKPELIRAVYDPEGEMKAAMILLPDVLNMAGAHMPMGSIAGVVSLPENRRGGWVGHLLVESIREMKEQGIPISALYPFKQSFYQRYGWDLAAAWLEHEIPVELLSPSRKRAGLVRRYLPGEAPVKTLLGLYGRHTASELGYMVRDEWFWHNRVNRSWGKPQWETAVWQPAKSAEPEGYMLYRFGEENGQRHLIIKELVGLTQAAERGLLGFVANHDSQVKNCRIRFLRDYPLWHLVENTHDVQSKLIAGWQLRLVDLKSAFEQRPWPGAPNGSLVIGVLDEHAPWNSGTWRILFEGGQATVTPAPEELPGLSATVQTWAQLYAGFVKPGRAAVSGRLEAPDAGALRLLTQVTADREMFFYEFF